MKSSSINFKELGKLMTESQEDKDINDFRQEIYSLNESSNHQGKFEICSKYLIKMENLSFTNTDLVSDHLIYLILRFFTKINSKYTHKILYSYIIKQISLIKEELLKSANFLLVDKLKHKKTLEAKIYLEVLEKYKSPSYDLFVTTTNNRCCYFSSNEYFRNAIELMNGLRAISLVKSLRDMIISNKINLLQSATSNLQLCAFYSQNKNNSKAYKSGLASLAISQYHQVMLGLKAKIKSCSNENDKESLLNDKGNDKNEEMEDSYDELVSIETSNSSNLIVSYYNIGVQQEYLKRVGK